MPTSMGGAPGSVPIWPVSPLGGEPLIFLAGAPSSLPRLRGEPGYDDGPRARRPEVVPKFHDGDRLRIQLHVDLADLATYGAADPRRGPAFVGPGGSQAGP